VDLAEAYWTTRRYREALEKSDEAIALAPDQMWPYLVKFFNYMSWKSPESVIKERRATLEAMPANISDDWVDYVWFLQNVLEGRYQEALRRLASSRMVGCVSRRERCPFRCCRLGFTWAWGHGTGNDFSTNRHDCAGSGGPRASQ